MTKDKTMIEKLFGCDYETIQKRALSEFAVELADSLEKENKKILDKFIQQNNHLQLISVSCVGDEYAYLNAKYPDYEVEEQSVCYSQELDKHYDAIKIKLPTGEIITVNFDISSFY